MRTDRLMDMAKITVANRNFPKVPKKTIIKEAESICFLRQDSIIKKLP